MAVTSRLLLVLDELVLGGPAAVLVGKGASLIVGCELNLSVFKVGARPLLVEKLIHILRFFLALNVLDEG
jgi:hypothetical protein